MFGRRRKPFGTTLYGRMDGDPGVRDLDGGMRGLRVLDQLLCLVVIADVKLDIDGFGFGFV